MSVYIYNDLTKWMIGISNIEICSKSIFICVWWMDIYAILIFIFLKMCKLYTDRENACTSFDVIKVIQHIFTVKLCSTISHEIAYAISNKVKYWWIINNKISTRHLNALKNDKIHERK